MDNDQLLQIKEESESWKRLLDFIQLENIMIKTRISDIINIDITRELLALVEEFQQRCIRKDELVSTLRREVSDFDYWISQANRGKKLLPNIALEKQRQLRLNIQSLAQRFHHLKFRFHEFVANIF